MADGTPQGTKKKVSSAYPTGSVSWTEKPIPGLTITTAFAVWLGVTTVIVPALAQKYYYDSGNSSNSLLPLPPISILGWSIIFFNNLNVLIAFCEIALGNHITYIQDHYRSLVKEYRDDKTGKPTKAEYLAGFSYLNMPLSLRDIYDGGEKWSRMWSTYSLWDPSYSNPESFGFFIDVGNGWSTILPCWLWNFAIIFPHFFTPSNEAGENTDYTAVVLLGFIGAMSYWQVLYGTIIYFLSFLWNKRYENKPLVEVLGFVGFANGIWFFFPIACLLACYKLLLDRDPLSLFWF